MAINLDRETVERLLRDSISRLKKADVAKTVRGIVARSPALRRLLRGPLADLADDAMTLVAMIKDYVSGEYREVPQKSILAATAALIYILNPFDLIPDMIPGIGLMDDAAVLALVVKAIQSDVQNYRSWSQKLKRRARQMLARI